MDSSTDLVLTHEVPRLPPRPADAHKGTFGKVLLVAGSTGMPGAAVLAGRSALRGGAGLVQLAVPDSVEAVVSGGQPCYMVRPLPADEQGRVAAPAIPAVRELIRSASAVVAGPGLGQSGDVASLVRTLLAEASQPVVLDADGLNVLGPNPAELRQRQGPFVLTPHPGEFARLAGSDTKSVQANRIEQAAAFTRRHGGVVVLKGAGTVVTDGRRTYVNTTGNPGMATGGSGDVLSGLLGALLAQRLEAFEAAVLGVYLHGLAGDLAKERFGEVSLIATDLIDVLPMAFQRHAGKV